MRSATSFRTSAAILLTSSVLALVLAPTLAEARPGIRGGASSSMRGGGGGGGFSRGGFGGGSSARQGGGGFGGGARQGGGFGGAGASTRPANRPSAGQLPAGGGNRVNNGGDRINGGGNSIGGGNRVNNGGINTGDVNINRNVNVGDNRYDWNDYYRPVGGAIVAGAIIGAAAATTAAALGSYYYALPSGCSPYPYRTYTYYACGSVYYETRYEGDKVVYVVVEKPE
jgi:hypothetical protein